MSTEPSDAKLRAAFDAKIDRSDSCWVWTGEVNPQTGYGRFRGQYAHRVAYFFARGEIPPKMVIDHVCRNRLCVNPDHLEAVTNRDNILRGVGATAINARKTQCRRGHEFTPENTYVTKDGERRCRQCNRDRLLDRARSLGVRSRRRDDLDTDEIVRRRDAGESFRSIGGSMKADHKLIADRYRKAKAASSTPKM